MKHRMIWILLSMIAAVILIFTVTGAALAAVCWCDSDLGPMAVVAEERNSEHAYKAEGKVISVPVQAVSISKGGANTHK